MQDQPNGYCQCGCGQKTRLAPYSAKRLGWVKGEPIRYLNGHWSRRGRVPEASDYTLDAQTGCWIWRYGRSDTGYGTVASDGRIVNAHRWYYEHYVGAVPSGLELDHLCRVRACVNPAHLEPVTHAENVRRGAAAITHCLHGHEYTPENTYVRPDAPHRQCRTCIYERGRQTYARNRERINERQRAAYRAKQAKPEATA